MKYSEMTKEQLAQEIAELKKQYQEALKLGLKLDMSRGVPCKEQINLTTDMLKVLSEADDCFTENGIDCRNYGQMDGIPEAKKLFADLLEVPVTNVIVCGNSSLNIMYDTVARCMMFGVCGNTPWYGQKIKFLCPVPGYDRHFAICDAFGIEMIPVEMNENGPDMDMIEKLVSEDAQIKGIWCVPKYANPDGTVYSDDTIRRFAVLKPAANDFRIFWDNAYIVHSLYGAPAKQLNLLEELKKYGNDNMAYEFASTSKISYPGSGVAVVASSDNNIAQIKSCMKIQTIGHDKINQLRHVQYFGSVDGILRHMEKHAALIRPKFECVLEKFEKQLGEAGIGSWSKPQGGYFISLQLPEGCAKQTYKLLADLGVKITNCGATYPYGKDPKDSNLRIAPTFPSIKDLAQAADMLCLCAKLTAAEKLYETK